MATWDGSYPAEEESNYFVYSGQNAPGTTVDSWPYFTGNSTGNPAYLPDIASGNYFPPASDSQHMYEQNRSTSDSGFYTNILPIPSNMVPLGNSYQEHILPNTSPVDGVQVSNSLQQHSAKGTRFSRNVSSSSRDNYNRKPRNNRMTGNYASTSEGDNSIQSSIVVNSNLHPTASEFVPNDAKFKKDKFNKSDTFNNAAGNNFNVSVQGCRPRPVAPEVSLPDNRYNKSERRYDNKRNMYYKQRSPQDAQAPSRSNYKDAYRTYGAKSYNKFKNDKYYNKRRQTDMSSGTEQHAVEKPITTDSTSSSMSSSLVDKISVEGIPEDDFLNVNATKETLSHENNDSESASSRGDMQRNDRSKRFGNHANTFNYHKYNPDGLDRPELIGRITRRYTGNSRSERYESNYKGKKNSFNYQAGSRGNSYSKRSGNEKLDDRDSKDGNNEEITNHKEKKVENWRDRTESNGTTVHTQRRNLQKKYEIGTYTCISGRIHTLAVLNIIY